MMVSDPSADIAASPNALRPLPQAPRATSSSPSSGAGNAQGKIKGGLSGAAGLVHETPPALRSEMTGQLGALTSPQSSPGWMRAGCDSSSGAFCCEGPCTAHPRGRPSEQIAVFSPTLSPPPSCRLRAYRRLLRHSEFRSGQANSAGGHLLPPRPPERRSTGQRSHPPPAPIRSRPRAAARPCRGAHSGGRGQPGAAAGAPGASFGVPSREPPQ